MSMAWETTEEDLETVLKAHGLNKTPAEITAIHDSLDMEEVEKAALNGNDMDEQTNYAFQEIEDQLIADEILPEGTRTKFPTD